MTAKVRESGLTADECSAALGEALNNWFTKFGPVPIFKSCANCTHMVNDGSSPAYCGLYKMTPPVATIVVGCPSHVDAEEIPF